jgi:quercetin dioxygenase-like cupin family protein
MKSGIKTNVLQRAIGLTLLFALGLLAIAIGQTGAVFQHVVIAPSDLKWEDNAPRPGQRRAVLFGDPQKPGPFTQRVRFPANTLNAPHTHPDDRQVTVLSGTWYLGQGDKVDREKAIKVLPGTFFTEPGKAVHWAFTGPEEVIVQASGIGPTSTDYVKR